MKLSANESLHCTDYEMVCDRNVFGCFTPGGSPQSLNYVVTAIYDVIIQTLGAFPVYNLLTLGASARGKAAEKISVTYHFVISAM